MARKILLADDSVTAQNMGRKILADAGYEVITVNNGSAALKKIAEQKPDLIVLDVYMPGYSGLEVCQRLKESQETARTPVLLTVGKLEPFKPEEARRVRAEGFIVKPFEASELLSALSKLEDKIVPLADASRSGRFGRSAAAAEESGRLSKSNGDDEDAGWKNRIAFPTKKKGKPEKEDGDDPAIYNALNRDLRTVVEREPSPKEKEKDAIRPSNSIIAPAVGATGVPGDVSAEEIAAIAAAAAQIQGISTGAGDAGETSRAQQSESIGGTGPAAGLESGKIGDPVGETENNVGAQSRVPEETVPPESLSTVVSAEVNAPATFAETTIEKVETSPQEDDGKMAAAAASNAEVAAAIAALEPTNGNPWNAGRPASGQEEVAVTMAVASADGEHTEKRWMAIPVAVGPEEAETSLELEMQKAYAAFAAAEANCPGFISSAPEPVAQLPVAITPVQATVAEPEHVALAPTSDLEAPVNMPVGASAEPVQGTVTEVEAVAATAPDTPSQVPVASEQPDAASSSDIASRSESLDSPTSVFSISDPPDNHQELNQGADQTLQNLEAEAVEQPATEVVHAAEPTVMEASAPNSESTTRDAKGTAEETESDLAASTAAAWATWRQIRETAQPQPAAMAVAAGAEKAPEEASAAEGDDSAAIASIVDSVLADLRPKIVEEISRKLGKKK